MRKLLAGLALLGALAVTAHAQTQINLATQVRGVLPVANGGTGSSAATVGAHTFLGNNTGLAAAPAYLRPACADLSNSAASCATDATNATNISSGTLAAARGGAGTVSGALKGNGAGVVSQAACADLSNGATGCSTAVGTSGATLPLFNGTNTWSGTQGFASGSLQLNGATSGTLTLKAAATAGINTITFPAGTTDFSATGGTSQFLRQNGIGAAITVVQPAASDLSNGTTGSGAVVLAAAPTITGHPTIEGVTSTGATGTGALVFGTSPVFTTSIFTPAVDSGAPSALSLRTNTGTEQVQIVHTASATRALKLTGSNGGNPTIDVTAGNLAITPAVVLASSLTFSTAAGKIIPGATSISLRNNADNADNLIITDAGAVTVRSTLTASGDVVVVGTLAAPVTQNSQSVGYTLVLSDAGKHIYHPSTDNNARTFTIPANASVAYPVGTMITFVNEINTVTIAITTDTLVLAGTGSTGSRTLAANGVATAVKVGTTRWFIYGSGLT